MGSDASIVERLLYACAAHGIFQLTTPTSSSTGGGGGGGTAGAPRFVNTAKSAVLRKNHPNTQWAWAGHNAEDMLLPWAKSPRYM